MIGEGDEGRFLPHPALLEAIDQAPHLSICERDLGVVERVQVAKIAGGEFLGVEAHEGVLAAIRRFDLSRVRLFEEVAGSIDRLVGRMRIEDVHVQEERVLPVLFDPVDGLIDDAIGGRTANARRVERLQEVLVATGEVEARIEDPAVGSDGPCAVSSRFEDFGDGLHRVRQTVGVVLRAVLRRHAGRQERCDRGLGPRRRRGRLQEEVPLFRQCVEARCRSRGVPVGAHMIGAQCVDQEHDDIAVLAAPDGHLVAIPLESRVREGREGHRSSWLATLAGASDSEDELGLAGGAGLFRGWERDAHGLPGPILSPLGLGDLATPKLLFRSATPSAHTHGEAARLSLGQPVETEHHAELSGVGQDVRDRDLATRIENERAACDLPHTHFGDQGEVVARVGEVVSALAIHAQGRAVDVEQEHLAPDGDLLGGRRLFGARCLSRVATDAREEQKSAQPVRREESNTRFSGAHGASLPPGSPGRQLRAGSSAGGRPGARFDSPAYGVRRCPVHGPG